MHVVAGVGVWWGTPATLGDGIVAVAGKPLIALWRYLETGVLPEGAVRKA